MKKNKSAFGIKFLLFIIFILGVIMSVLIILDAEVFNYVIKPPERSGIQDTTNTGGQQSPDNTAGNSSGGSGSVTSNDVERYRKSILWVKAQQCGSAKGRSGTGFVISPGYLATNAHVISNEGRNLCRKIEVVDYKGKVHKAFVEGVSLESVKKRDFANDLAVLRIEETSLPPLPLVDSHEYESGKTGQKIFTFGYPLPGTASSPEKATMSDEGSISQFATAKNCFITSGMKLNGGNSGGPVLLSVERKVLGVAVASVYTDIKRGRNETDKVPVNTGYGYVIPSNRLRTFFKEKTGKSIARK